ncbi:SdpA family antimicrobial peptide system protein [Marinitenerispora sediminis]|uniref:SdpA family antimicrobial peptide system protein n=3 Tax=Marinitenerispora sediminis TaxID=1931232 RepID=UPI00131500AA|nr:SdpA family antimicrobial peptide system protein [Marinitenerispora sediminis]
MSGEPRIGAPRGVAAEGGEPSPAARRAFTLGGAAVVALVLLVLLASVPNTVAAGGGPLRLVGELAPQGWAFFTGSPREPALLVYQQVDGEWRRVSSSSGGEPRRLFGLDRTTRTERHEIQSLAWESRDAAWTPCDRASVAACLPDESAPVASVPAGGSEPRFCGPVALVRQEPVPWDRARTTEEMPPSLKILHVGCPASPQGG